MTCYMLCRILLGRHKSAIECYKTAISLGGKDWEICQSLGICAQFLKDYKQVSWDILATNHTTTDFVGNSRTYKQW